MSDCILLDSKQVKNGILKINFVCLIALVSRKVTALVAHKVTMSSCFFEGETAYLIRSLYNNVNKYSGYIRL